MKKLKRGEYPDDDDDDEDEESDGVEVSQHFGQPGRRMEYSYSGSGQPPREIMDMFEGMGNGSSNVRVVRQGNPNLLGFGDGGNVQVVRTSSACSRGSRGGGGGNNVRVTYHYN